MSELEKLDFKLTRYLGDVALYKRYNEIRYPVCSEVSIDEFLDMDDKDDGQNIFNSRSMFSYFIDDLLDGYFDIDDGNNYPYKIYFDSALEMIKIDFQESLWLHEFYANGGYSLQLSPTEYGVEVLTEQDYIEILGFIWEELKPYTREYVLEKIVDRINH